MSDLIRRDDAIKAVMLKKGGLCLFKDDGNVIPNMEDPLVKAITDIPSVEPKTGKWIYEEHQVAMCDGYYCDKCGFFAPWDYQHKSIDFIKDYHYCPNCGVRMEGDSDE